MAAQELETFAKFERYYNAGGIRTRCFEKGEGEAVILLHGGGGHAETWVRNLIPLSEKFRVLAIDYLGHGYTDKPKITYSLDAFSKHLVDFMDAAGIKKAHLVGESQGGQISVLTAYEHPERVDRLGSYRRRYSFQRAWVHVRPESLCKNLIAKRPARRQGKRSANGWNGCFTIPKCCPTSWSISGLKFIASPIFSMCCR